MSLNLQVKYASIRKGMTIKFKPFTTHLLTMKGRQELRYPPNALLLNPDGTVSFGFDIGFH